MTRRSGRTQRMIDELVDAVVEGQPYSLVVAVSEVGARHIADRVLDALASRDLVVVVRDHKVRLDVEGSTIWFAGRDKVLQRRYAGRRGLGEFWDHAALEHTHPNMWAMIQQYFGERDARETGCGTMTGFPKYLPL